jgi:bifunctional ADP-heptose synthase (sugar kinase/adenylyltransferase)
MTVPLVVVGDTLLDVEVEGDVERLCPEAPVPVLDEGGVTRRPGGAGLAAALAAVLLAVAVAAFERADL